MTLTSRSARSLPSVPVPGALLALQLAAGLAGCQGDEREDTAGAAYALRRPGIWPGEAG